MALRARRFDGTFGCHQEEQRGVELGGFEAIHKFGADDGVVNSELHRKRAGGVFPEEF